MEVRIMFNFNQSFKGLRIGNYRITPLGLVTLAILAILIIGGVALAVAGGGKPDNAGQTVASATPDSLPAVNPGVPDAPTAAPTRTPNLRSATIRSLGEIAMQRNLLLSAVSGNTFTFDDMFADISSVIGDADYTVADVEGSLGGTTEYSGIPTKMVTPPSLIGTLKDCGVDMLILANDHALDGGWADLQATIQNCQNEGMDYIGAAASAEERATPFIKTIGGINVAFLSYTDSLNGNEKHEDSAAVEYGVNLITKKTNAKQDIELARAAGADVVVCYVSWGEMLNYTPTDSERQLAQALCNYGADVIIGYNPHVIQPAGWLESTDSSGNVHRTLCLGATGNLLSDQYGKYDCGIIFQFTIQETEYGHFAITSPTYIPTYVWRSEGENGKYTYRSLAIGQWLEKEPEGMAYADAARMRQLWATIQKYMGTSVAVCAAE